MDRLVTALGDVTSGQLTEFNLRLYDGWFDGSGIGTDLFEMLRIHLRTAYPVRFRRARVFVQAAAELVAAPGQTIVDTARTGTGLTRYHLSIAQPPYASCTAPPGDCLAWHLRSWLKGRCPHESGCPVTPDDVLSYRYQKLVDTSLVADAVFLASNGNSVAVVSDDEDVIPGIITAASFGNRAFWVSSKVPRAPYELPLRRSGAMHIVC